jgi:hypothetical protein
MFASSMGFGLDTRTLRVQVPALTESSLPAVCLSLQAGQSTYNRPGADGFQRPLRSRFQPQLTPGVRRQRPCGSHHKTDLLSGYSRRMLASPRTALRLMGLDSKPVIDFPMRIAWGFVVFPDVLLGDEDQRGFRGLLG